LANGIAIHHTFGPNLVVRVPFQHPDLIASHVNVICRHWIFLMSCDLDRVTVKAQQIELVGDQLCMLAIRASPRWWLIVVRLWPHDFSHVSFVA
jgi:hypothetical protein